MEWSGVPTPIIPINLQSTVPPSLSAVEPFQLLSPTVHLEQSAATRQISTFTAYISEATQTLVSLHT